MMPPSWLWNKNTSAAYKVSQPQRIPSTQQQQAGHTEIQTEGNIVSVLIMTFKTWLYPHLSHPIRFDELSIRSQGWHMAVCAAPKPQLCSARVSLDESSVCAKAERATSASEYGESADYTAHNRFNLWFRPQINNQVTKLLLNRLLEINQLIGFLRPVLTLWSWQISGRPTDIT